MKSHQAPKACRGEWHSLEHQRGFTLSWNRTSHHSTGSAKTNTMALYMHLIVDPCNLEPNTSILLTKDSSAPVRLDFTSLNALAWF